MLAVAHATPHARRRLVALLNGPHIQNGAAGTDYDTTYRLSVVNGPSALTDLQIVLAGWYESVPGGPEANATNDVTYKIAIETAGTKPVLFPGGVRPVTVSAGQTIVSLPLQIAIAANVTFVVRVETAIVGPSSLPETEVVYTNTFQAGDHVDATGALTSSNAIFQGGPIAILGRMANPSKRTVAIVGDSIAEGYYSGRTYNGTTGGGDNTANRGYLRAALGTNFANVNVAVPGESVTTLVNGGGNGRLDLLRLCGCDYALCEYALNDLYALGRSASQVEADLVTMWKLLVPRCPMGVWQCTITPRSTSSDGWAAGGSTNQNISGPTGNVQRILLNNWIRDGAPLDATLLTPVATGTGGALRAGSAGHPLKGYFEIADLAESARDSGFWTAGSLTSDGVHPNGTGVPVLKAGINTALFV